LRIKNVEFSRTGFPESCHLFCRVVDNFGDVGVCWRLARQFAGEHTIYVTLWVDDLASFRKICSGVDPQCDEQEVQGVHIRHWRDDFPAIASQDIADMVIEAFACELPHAYLAAMAMRTVPPVWINLEYLSAEPWVEGCHAMASRHPVLPLVKHFFFPGFSGKTGGLLAEHDLSVRRAAFQGNRDAITAFFCRLGVEVAPGTRTISLFCYQNAPVAALLDALAVDTRPSLCLVPEGIAAAAIGAFMQQPVIAGSRASRGGLTIQILPFMDQPDYDCLLWACDLNFVRGEDSFVRAQWAARPFLWQIYPQEEGAHWPKLSAFLDCYSLDMSDDATQALAAVWQAWNGAGDFLPHWRSFMAVQAELSDHARKWAQQLSHNGDLATNLVQFAKKIG
jgi:uncharacterized repeat protein (TIGR03837 family)